MSLGSCNHQNFIVVFDSETNSICPVCDTGEGDEKMDYVDRGNVVAYDFGVNDLIADLQWHDLDISHIVPEGERLVSVTIAIQPTTAGLSLRLRHPNHTGNKNAIRVYASDAGRCAWESGMVLCSTVGKLKYCLNIGSYTSIHITIRGWFA